MAKYTLGSLIEEVKQRIGDEEYPTEDILSYLNSTQQEVLGEDRYPFMEKIFEYDGVGSGELELPLDYQSVIQVLVDGNPLKYSPFDSYSHSALTGEYSLFANRLFYSADTSESHRIQIFYLATPNIMSDDSEPYIPEEFREILILGALVRIERARDNYDFAAVHRSHMDELVLNLKYRYCRRQQGFKSISRLPIKKMGRI